MSEEQAFLRAIRKEPDDPTHRLVYADWLEERGEAPRGEYLRLGVQIARMQARMRELREGLAPEWVVSVREGRHWWSLSLRTGRTIYLRALDQHSVYEGLLEGLPTTLMNREIVERTMAEARARHPGQEPFLIQPRETPVPYRDDRPYPFGEPARLPGAACVGRFTSLSPARGAGDYSELVVVWFQDEFALPIAPDAFEQLVAMDWGRHAADFEY